MGVYAKAHLIYGYRLSDIKSIDLNRDLFEKYNNPTAIKPGLIWGYEEPEFFGCLIDECEEDNSVLVMINSFSDFKESGTKEELEKITGEEQDSPKVYLACLNH